MKIRFCAAALALFILPASQAFAHYLWIESAAGKKDAKIFYGEYEEGVRETAGGKLDEVTDLRVQIPGSAMKDFTPEKKQDHFGVPVPDDASGWLQIEELDREVKDWAVYDIGVVKPAYYASALVNGRPGVLPEVPEDKTRLAVYPLELGPKVKLQVFFEGAPLGGAKVKIHAPNLWSRELKADDSGIAVIDLPWPGQYVFEVIHKEKVSGEFKGAAYEAVRHRATFTWTLAESSRT